MICDHPQCTGVHDSGRYSELCPVARQHNMDLKRAWRERNRLRERAINNASAARKRRKLDQWRLDWFDSVNGLCTWCEIEMQRDLSVINVDHNNKCHTRWESAVSTSCMCIRGLVHTGCNIKYIATLEKYMDSGQIALVNPRFRDYFSGRLGIFGNG